MIDRTPYDTYRREKKLSDERNADKREAERQRVKRVMERAKEKLASDRWHGGKKKAITV